MNGLLRRLLWVAVLLAPAASAVELMEWDRRPLVIDLPVGQERLVVLDRNVSVGLPATIAQEDILRVQSTGGVLYLKAGEAFDTQRVQLRDEATGEIILVDLTARVGASDEQIQVISKSQPVTGTDTVDGVAASAGHDRERQAPMPVVLTRYAAQSLYAPLRVIEPVPGISRVAMRLPESVSAILPALPVEARPIAAWALDGWHVTAIQVRNLDPDRSFELDPRYLQGALIAATFMHPTLGFRGRMDDVTTVLVVTRGPLADQLLLPRIQPAREG